jgi:hypothetical protein
VPVTGTAIISTGVERAYPSRHLTVVRGAKQVEILRGKYMPDVLFIGELITMAKHADNSLPWQQFF